MTITENCSSSFLIILNMFNLIPSDTSNMGAVRSSQSVFWYDQVERRAGATVNK